MVLPGGRRWSQPHPGGDVGKERGGPWRVAWSVHSVNRLASWEWEAFCITWPHPSFGAMVLKMWSLDQQDTWELVTCARIGPYLGLLSGTLGVGPSSLFLKFFQMIPMHTKV